MKLFPLAIALVVAAGLFAAPLAESWVHAVFALCAASVLGFGLIANARHWQDILNPLTLLAAVGFLKFGVPYLLFLEVGPGAEAFAYYKKLGVLTSELMGRGHTVALMGICALTLGWSVIGTGAHAPAGAGAIGGEGPGEDRNFRPLGWSAAVRALCVMALGLTALFLFISRNADLDTALETGQFRSTDIQAGTGVFFYLALFLISGSVVAMGYLLERERLPVLVAWLPVLVAMAAYFLAGGRTRALTPVVAGAIALYHLRCGHRLPPRMLVGSLVFCLAIPVFYYLGSTFRGGAGMGLFTGETSADDTLGDYLAAFFTAELGQLNSIAGAIALGGGVLGGVSFSAALFPLDRLFSLPGRSGGSFLVEELLNVPKGTVGSLHPSLIGDAYLNFGLIGVAVVLAVAGAGIKLVYLALRHGRMHPAIYALVVVYAVRVFGEEINKWPEFMIVVWSAWLLTLPVRSARSAAPAVRGGILPEEKREPSHA